MNVRVGKLRLGKVRPGLLVAFGFVLLLATSVLRIVPWSVTIVVLALIVVGVVISSLVHVVWVWGKRGPSVPMQVTLFRAVFVALAALLALVMVGQWWSHRQSSRDQRFTSSDLALAELNIAYMSQPTISGSYTETQTHLRIHGKGVWLDVTAYERIKRVIDDGHASVDEGTMLLSAPRGLALRSLLPPSLGAAYPGRAHGAGMMELQGYFLPNQIPWGLLPLDGWRRDSTNVRRLRDYIKEHGWIVGSTTGPPDHEKTEYAVWRTGPDTAAWVESNPGQANRWYFGLFPRFVEGMFLYMVLAPFAAVAAWYLNRRLVRPVQQVAAASTKLARGKRPEPIMVKGPAELATLAASFNQMSDKLTQAQAAQRHFLMSVSHELKTPLTAIDGYAELLSEGAVAGEQAGPVLQAETARLKRLVGDLLESARVQKEGFSVRKAPVALPRVAEEVARRYERQARDFGVKLSVRQPEEAGGRDESGPWVRGDEDRLVQVVSNLVENALRCTPEGGEVEIIVTATGGLEVRDTGPGLQQQDLPHAFERFYLYERCGEERPLGTGLGLAIVKQLTKAMGGQVTVESQPGAGTVFSVELPAAVASEGPEQDA
jgi:signal transduction histidine kinase